MKTEKVCLIIPDSIFLLDARVFPFLGILGVAAALEKEGVNVDVIDLSGISNWENVLSDYFDKNTGKISVGLTATSPQMPMAYKISRFIKSNYGHKIIIGGTHVSVSNAGKKMEIKNGIKDGRAFKDIEQIKKDFDVLVYGEGDIAIFDALKMESGEIDADDKNSKYFLSKDKVQDLILPARHLIDLKSYVYHIDGRLATPFLSEFACYFKCAFCCGRNTSFLRYVRQKSPEGLKEELKHLHSVYGYTAFQDYSDEINVPKNMELYFKALMDAQEELGVDFRFRAFIKAELFTEEQAKKLYDTGFRTLLCGFESGDEKILRNIKKIAKRDDNTRVVEICKKYGIKIKALMSMGHAGETYESIEETKKWLLETQPDDFDITVITPYCGSPYFDDARRSDSDPNTWIYEDNKTGDRLYQKSVDYSSEVHSYKGIPGEYVSYCWTDDVSAEELVKERDSLEFNVREKLKIPFNQSGSSKKYEHSMGQGNVLPDWILRSSNENVQNIETKEKKLRLNVI